MYIVKLLYIVNSCVLVRGYNIYSFIVSSQINPVSKSGDRIFKVRFEIRLLSVK